MSIGWIGQSEGFGIIGIILFVGLCSLLSFHALDGGQFVSAFQVLVLSYFGGGAAAAFRDFKKGVANGN